MLGLTFIFASMTLFILHPLAIKWGFVDRPSERKLHDGNIPLIGGLSIFLPVFIILLLFPELISNSSVFLLCSTTLFLIGLVDDKIDLSVTVRITLISAISIWLVLSTGFKIHYLGNLIGLGKVELGELDVIITVIAIIGSLTAFNMIDGLDGLLGGLAIVTFSALAVLFAINNLPNLLLFCSVIIVSIIPYVICNLELIPKKNIKIFMGDSGSLFIGFTVIWLLIEASQSINEPQMVNKINPVTVLWIIAIPLMDMVYTMLRRIRKKQSPFKADREHIHHVFARLGFTSLQTLGLICFIASLFATVGIIGELLHISEVVMFSTFIFTFICYYLCFTYIWKITVFLRNPFTPSK